MTTARRILLVLTQALNPHQGGVQMSTCKMGAWFAAHGHTVAVFSFEREGHVAPDWGELHVAAADGGASSTENQQALVDVLKAFEPDVVINQTPYEHAVGHLLKAHQRYVLLGVLRNTLFSVKNNLRDYAERSLPARLQPVLNNRVGRRVLLERHRRRHRQELNDILSTYDRFVMFGPPNLDELRYFVSTFDRRRTALIPNSIPDVLDEVPTKEQRLLWLGRLDEKQKRLDLVAPLWERLAPQLPGWTLDVVGEGPDRPALERAIAERGLERVVLHGRQPPNAYFERSRIFLMTSAFEGFPNTVAEAQSFGAIPVLFSSFPIASWMVRDHRDGVLVSPFDIDAMANAIVAIARDERLAASMATQALKNAQRFHIDRVGKMWEALFDECAADRMEAAA